MKIRTLMIVVTLVVAVSLVGSQARAGEYQGTARLGWVFLDEEGNKGVNHSTFNTYEGGALSLEDLSYRFDNGVRLFGDLRNITLNNRNLKAGITKNRLFGVTLTNKQFRRTYTFDGDKYTRRHQTNGRFWVQPHRMVRLYGGYGSTGKSGRTVDLFEPTGGNEFNEVDYTNSHFHGGVTVQSGRSVFEAELRGGSFCDEIDELNDRKTTRWRFTGRSPVPQYERVQVFAGFQRFVNRLENRDDTLMANTFWGGTQVFLGQGFQARYSFMFDRARRTGDPLATDNIAHALSAGKTWRRVGGIMAGYRNEINDDLYDEVATDAYFFSGWLVPLPGLKLRAGHGSEQSEVQAGRTLTGDTDIDRMWCSARYSFAYGYARVKFVDRQRENADIGSTADYTRVGLDLVANDTRYGRLSLAYAYYDGVYENSESLFGFHEHVLDGDVQSPMYRGLNGGVGLTYMHSYRDLDIETIALRFNAGYQIAPRMRIDVNYAAYNYDDFDDPSPVYREYYTANVVEVILSRDF